MTDTKNIVIKVKYTAPDAAAGLPPKMITEWHVGRIAGALGILILLLAALFFFRGGKTEQKSSTKNLIAPVAAPAASSSTSAAQPQAAPAAAASTPSSANTIPKPGQSTPVSAKASFSGRIRRATLAYRIIDKEPADLIGSTIRVRGGRPILVHYFTEVRGKIDQTLFHEWLKDGHTILRYPVTIAAERWRTSSQHQFSSDDMGLWSVRTVDDKGSVMNEIQFTVSAK